METVPSPLPKGTDVRVEYSLCMWTNAIVKNRREGKREELWLSRLLCRRPALGTTLLKHLTVKPLAPDAKERAQFSTEAEEEDKGWGFWRSGKLGWNRARSCSPEKHQPYPQCSAAVARHSRKARSDMSGNWGLGTGLEWNLPIKSSCSQQTDRRKEDRRNNPWLSVLTRGVWWGEHHTQHYTCLWPSSVLCPLF